jgi:putative membrane protein
MTDDSTGFDAKAIERPDDALLRYYFVVSLLTLIGFPFVFLAHYVKFKTLRYKIDDEGVSMSWGFLMKKEVLLTYRRIQDIHVNRNIVHRWLGLASVAIQTASGASGAEMTIEGVLEPESLRDFLYMKMRGARGDAEASDKPAESADEALVLLHEIRDGLRALRADGPGAP